jgi:hypothetical protein
MAPPASHASSMIDDTAEPFADVLHPSAKRIERPLSKSDHKAARTCPVKLFFRENRYPDATQYDPDARLLQRPGDA